MPDASAPAAEPCGLDATAAGPDDRPRQAEAGQGTGQRELGLAPGDADGQLVAGLAADMRGQPLEHGLVGDLAQALGAERAQRGEAQTAIGLGAAVEGRVAAERARVT